MVHIDDTQGNYTMLHVIYPAPIPPGIHSWSRSMILSTW